MIGERTGTAALLLDERYCPVADPLAARWLVAAEVSGGWSNSAAGFERESYFITDLLEGETVVTARDLQAIPPKFSRAARLARALAHRFRLLDGKDEAALNHPANW